MRAAVLVVVTAVALTALGCSSSHHAAQPSPSTLAPTTTSTTIGLPTEAGAGSGLEAGIHGTLNYKDGCFRIGATVVVWPHGYHAAANPLRVIDNNGHVVGRVGDVITLNGGTAPRDSTAQQLVAAYPPLRRCLPLMACYTHPNPVLGCLDNVWFA